MKYSLVFILLFTEVVSSTGQDYFSNILDISKSSILTKQFYQNDDNQILVPYDFAQEGTNSLLHITNESNDIQEYEFDNLDLSARPIAVSDDYIFFVGENPVNIVDTTFTVIKMDKDSYELLDRFEIGIQGKTSTTLDIEVLDSFIYVLSFINRFYADDDSIHIELTKLSFEGDLIWQRKFNEDTDYSFPYGLSVADDGRLLLSGDVEPKDKGGRFPFLMKIRTDGTVVWNHVSEESIASAQASVRNTSLTDGSYIMTTALNRFPEFFSEGLHDNPPYFIWVNWFGKQRQEKIIYTPRHHIPYYYGVEAGKGDYFYVHGKFENITVADERDRRHAHIVKYSNDGDSIWVKNYQHPDFVEDNAGYLIKDVNEDENGDITMLIDIYRTQQPTKVWLLKVNENGCQGTVDCDEFFITSVLDSEILPSTLTIYPNPTSDYFTINTDEKISRYSLVNMSGEVVQESAYERAMQISTKSLPSGMYIVNTVGEDGSRASGKIMVKR